MEDAAERPLHDVYRYQSRRPSASYAFLNHSATTLPNNLPPSVDDKPLARQRRRRTSPEDQTILEAAYSHDPKPDKVARLELVKRVGLGEKEVQIWFQNRRQTSRRKSRPLLPHEIAQYQLSRSGVTSQPPLSDHTSGASFDDGMQPCADLTDDNDQRPDSQPFATEAAELEADAQRSESCLRPELTSSQDLAETRDEAPHAVRLAQTCETKEPRVASVTSTHEPIGGVGYLANRRSAPSLFHSQSSGRPTAPSCDITSVHPRQCLKKAPSFVRLSMTGEGNAKIVTKDSLSPSPPRPSQGPQPASGSGNEYRPTECLSSARRVPAVTSLQRSSSGRSRDSRAWEFWCDKDARGELEEKAEKDASGSAADAIGLLRSASGRRILGTIPSKRNSVLSGHPTSLKRSKLDQTRPPLQKSSTSSGKLQGNPTVGGNALSKPAPKLKYSQSSVSVYIPGNESDKENWSPDVENDSDLRSERSSNTAYYVTSKPCLTLGSNQSIEQPRQKVVMGSLKRSGKALSNSENDPEADPELAAFMRGARRSSNMSEEEDLDCVQGLLSLSQGNWR